MYPHWKMWRKASPRGKWLKKVTKEISRGRAAQAEGKTRAKGPEVEGPAVRCGRQTA